VLWIHQPRPCVPFMADHSRFRQTAEEHLSSSIAAFLTAPRCIEHPKQSVVGETPLRKRRTVREAEVILDVSSHCELEGGTPVLSKALEPAMVSEDSLLSDLEARTPDLFEHAPLNLQSASIRVIQICPAREPSEQIRCDIRLTSTDAEYVCLSYVWGEAWESAAPSKWILLNGQRQKVRLNLWDFLMAARDLPELRACWIWIDALCIDQSNTLERQHQVQQMGRIYSKAKSVISWLGTDENIAAFLGQNGPADLLSAKADAFSRSPYWTRAWITQEIILGRQVIFMARDKMMALDALPKPQSDQRNHNRVVDRIMDMRAYYRLPDRTKDTLILILDTFKDQGCRVRRDRIFSLLALCGDGVDIKVDYSNSDTELAWTVMRTGRDTFCLCSISTVGYALGLQSQSYSNYLIPATNHSVLTLPIIWSWKEQSNADFFKSQLDSWGAYISSSRDKFSRHRPGHIMMNTPSTWASDGIRMAITIDLQHICSSHSGNILIFVDPDNAEFWYHLSCYNNWETPRHGMGIQLQPLDDGRSCNVCFPLEIWLYFATMSNRWGNNPRARWSCPYLLDGPSAHQLADDDRPGLHLLGQGELPKARLEPPFDASELARVSMASILEALQDGTAEQKRIGKAISAYPKYCKRLALA
jgi:hypothetical protein